MTEQEASYEVCILVGSRWEIHARYPLTGAADAIEEAKQLEQTSRAAIKVVREIYDSDTGLYRQVTVYKGAHMAAAARKDSPGPKAPRYRAPAGGDADFDLDELLEDGLELEDSPHFAPAKKPGAFARYLERRRQVAAGRRRAPNRGPKRVTIAGLLVRIAALVTAGLFVAALATGLLPSFAPDLAQRNLVIPGGAQTSVLFVVFIGTFLVTFAILSAIVLTGVEIIMPKRKVRRRVARPQRGRRLGPLPKLVIPDFSVLDRPPEAAPEPPPERAPEPPAPPVDFAAAAETPPAAEAPPPADATGPQLSAAGRQQKARLAAFLAGALEEMRAAGPIDPFSRFGINLFVAGGVAALATTQAIDETDAKIMLAEGVASLGTPMDMASKFAESADSYLMQPRYVEMYEAGRRAMMSFLEGDSDGPHHVGTALAAWRNPAKREEKVGPLAVMFTDIVGSTNMTVTVGDDAAQYVVRTHNRIVRSALANYSGREVKHTGDGIMASFATVSNAVEAAVEMMRRVAANNAAEGDIPLHLKIGINAGEPVVEDDDLFGVTVQLAARMCAVAETDQIVVSDVVRGLCSGKDIRFVSRGIREMKGFREPVPVYEVVWRQGGGN